MCGIVGYIGSRDAISTIVSMMFELQHRGQEAAGVAIVSKDGDIYSVVGRGLVSEALSYTNLYKLYKVEGAFGGIGHIRYATSGGYLDSQVQPIVVGEDRFRVAIVFNGTIANYVQLAKEFDIKAINGDTLVFAQVLYKLAKEFGNDVIEALKVLPNYVIGGYSIAVLTSEPRIVVAKDPRGFRPLSVAVTNEEFFASSETAALDVIGINNWREILPGEIASYDGSSIEFTRTSIPALVSPCIFEYVYFSRPDSIFNGVSIYIARVRMGEELAKNVPANGDVVIPIPDSGRGAAIGFSRESKIPLEEGIVVNKYIGRGFIAPPTYRELVSKLKYGFIRSVIDGKKVILVDDSIVRGTTMRSIVNRLRVYGAKEVHVRVASPPFEYPCFMGIDIASRDELLAWRTMSLTDIAKVVEADSVGYNTLEGLLKSVGLPLVCHACFTGLYPFKGLTVDDLEKMFSREPL
jgi:amidophosphoribosyltransferase